MGREDLTFEYWQQRNWLYDDYIEWQGVIREPCGAEMLNHRPVDRLLVVTLPWLSPYLYTYYKNNF